MMNSNRFADRGEYGKGYDRLTGGFLVSEFIGYQHVSLNRRLNFYAGSTLGRRSDRACDPMIIPPCRQTNVPGEDITTTFRLGWCIPLWTGTGTTDIYY
ncbi:MAG: hypothetical protein IPJ06_20010 [Saprospiraceae bacterium]|nr:hypothetical protein [Saprospiraceae bacterium]